MYNRVTCVKRVNNNFQKMKPPLNPISVPMQIWSQVGMDIIGPLQLTKKGNQYIVAITDYLSKWVEAKPESTESTQDSVTHTVINRTESTQDTVITRT